MHWFHILLIRLVVALVLILQLPDFLFFLNDTATTEIYTLSLHDALPIYPVGPGARGRPAGPSGLLRAGNRGVEDRKSTRLNSSHQIISYAVFCLKKKKLRKLSVVTAAVAELAEAVSTVLDTGLYNEWCTP